MSFSNSKSKLRVLFFAEVVTLAHLARTIVLSQSLDPEVYDIHIACDDRYNHLLPALKLTFHRINTISGASFLKALASGDPIYKTETLIQYVHEDLEIIEEVKPDLIVGDFRLSLSISTRLSKVPYVTITNCYWSAFSDHDYPLPDHMMERLLGLSLGQRIFTLLRPLLFAVHCIPLNRARKFFGLPSLGYDLARVYTDADYVCYADIPELAKMTCALPDNHYYLGALIWSPSVSTPEWWGQINNASDPVIYISLGSSGDSKILPKLVAALSKLSVLIVIATAGGSLLGDHVPENVFVTDYISGKDATEAADLVICNGGSLTTQQAMILGKPVIGIVSNLDQHLNMRLIETAGAGILLRVFQAEKKIAALVTKVLADPIYKTQSRKFAKTFQFYQSDEIFREFVAQAVFNKLE